MKVLIRSGMDSDGHAWDELYINGNRKLSVRSLFECPEDAIIGRGLVSCWDVANFMEMVKEAIARGEDVEFNEEEVEGEED